MKKTFIFLAVSLAAMVAFATVRTKADLNTIYADNATGDISPQDLRDLVDSISVYGGIHVDQGVTAQTGIGGTPVKVTGFAGNGASNNVTADHTTDTLTLPAVAATYRAVAALSFSGTGNTTFTFYIRANGVEVPQCGMKRKIGTGGDVGSAAMTCLFTAAASDPITLYVEGDGTSDSITIEHGTLNVVRAL